MLVPCKSHKRRDEVLGSEVLENLDLLLTTAIKEEVVLGRIIDVQEYTNGTALDGVRGPAARGLAGECPLRLSPISHVCGHHIHLRSKTTGRVGCFAADSPLLRDDSFMDGWEYTASQLELIRVLHDATPSR